MSPIKPKFNPGCILMTPGAVDAMQRAGIKPSSLLVRHLTGDWGTLDAHDTNANQRALNPKDPLRILSSYVLSEDDTVWIITEWDRSVTTLLLPEEN